MKQNDTYTLITGASSGIGKAFAWYCGKENMNLLLVSLPDENLENVASEIHAKYKVKTNFFETDLSLPDGPEKVFLWAKVNNFHVNILINNAGIAGTTIFENSDPFYSDVRIMVNIRALVLLTNYFLPELKKMDSAYILNVGSLSAFFSIPYKAVYSASKAFVVNFSRALRYELRNSTVSVSVVCPNGVHTNAGTHSRIEAHGAKGRLTAVSADKLAEEAVKKMFEKQFLYIPLRINRFILVLQKLIPERILQNILTREFMKEVKISER